MSDKNQTSSKHQKLSGEKKEKKSGWISKSSGSGRSIIFVSSKAVGYK